uniref:Uncharacterized protein n=2 Tax=Hemiselmis andersenii TaxID=464988 RepID=A0A7S1DZY1_HEMAN
MGGKAKGKVSKKHDPNAKKGKSKGLDGKFLVHAKVLEARGEERYVRSEEQMGLDTEIAKEFARQSMKRHIEQQKWLTRKIRLRDQAIAALPEELQAEGKSMDEESFPLDRHIWTDFPPIKGFDPTAGDKKKRTEGL